jgi:DNA-binding MarR family transcriptional regulator
VKPTNNIGYLIQHLAITLARQSDSALQEALGIGFSQFKILMALQWNPHVQQRQIAENLGQTEASISRQVHLMHAKGLLKSEVSPSNRREHLTTPTEKGRALTERALEVLNAYHAPTFNTLDEPQRQQLMNILATMHEVVCQPGRVGSCQHPVTI